MSDVQVYQNGDDVAMLDARTLHLSPVEAITRGEIDMQIATAKRYPRSIAAFKKRALEMACADSETAASCFYTLPRAGKKLEGPSVRLGEIVASAYGNLRIAGRIIGVDDKEVTAQGLIHDLETNIAYSVEVKRRITDKQGKRFSDDMIIVTGNAAISIAIRNAILRAVPRAYVDPIYLEARRVAVGDGRTLEQRRQRAVEHFLKAGVLEERIYHALGVEGMEDIGLDELATLQGMKTAVDDGTSTLDELFPKPLDVKKPVFEEKPAAAEPAPSGLPLDAKKKPTTPKAMEE